MIWHNTKLSTLTATILFIIILSCAAAHAERIEIVTEDFAPFQHIENNQVVGMATEVVRAVLGETDIEGTIQIYPWARAYQMALDQENILIYSIARTKERESLFKWVGAIAPYNVYLFKLKSRDDIAVKTLDDAKKYTIGGEYKDVKQQYLAGKGFKKIQLVAKSHLNIKKFFTERFDLIPFDELGFVYKARELGFDVSKAEKVLFLDEISSDLYMAFSKNTSNEIVEKFRKALSKIKSDGRHQKIIDKYTSSDKQKK